MSPLRSLGARLLLAFVIVSPVATLVVAVYTARAARGRFRGSAIPDAPDHRSTSGAGARVPQPLFSRRPSAPASLSSTGARFRVACVSRSTCARVHSIGMYSPFSHGSIMSS